MLKKFIIIKVIVLITFIETFNQNYSYSMSNFNISDNDCYIYELEYKNRMETNKMISDISCTYYNPTIAQTDSTPFLTGSGSIIDTNKLKQNKLRWVACSWDLLNFGGGKLKYNDTIEVISTDNKNLNGLWIIKDATSPKIKKHIDFLCYNKINGKFNNIKIIFN